MISRAQRAWTVTLLVLLVVPGVVGFDLWPLTGWRLFSLSRDATQTEWALDAVRGDGSRAEIDLEQLPLAYRNAAWPLAELAGAPAARQREVCLALLGGVRRVLDTEELVIVRERRTMTVDGDDERIDEEREDIERCA